MAGRPKPRVKILIFAAMVMVGGCTTAQQVGCNTVEAGCRQQCRSADAGRNAEANACYERCAQQNTCRKG